MKKALSLVLLAWLGLFSFADAANLYDQPSSSYTATDTMQTSLSTHVASPDFSAPFSVSGTTTARFILGSTGGPWLLCLYDVLANTSICAPVITPTTGALVPYQLDIPPQSISAGRTYRLVFNAQLASPAVNATYPVDSSGRMLMTYGPQDALVVQPNWGLITYPPGVDFGAVPWVATSTGLFTNASATVAAIAQECDDSGNLFSRAICYSFSYLFIPDPSVLNQFTILASTTAGKFPFTYVDGIGRLIDATHASSTKNMITLSINFASVDPATSTPFRSFLPNVILFSSTTMSTYLGQGTWDFIYLMMEVSLWLGFLFFVIQRGAHIIKAV